MIKEFRDFIMKGNVLELAVAVIIAGAFGAVITSFTKDILMPPIGLALGNDSFTDLKFVLQAADGDITEVAIRWGQFIKYVIDFLIIAFILFLIVKSYNKMNKKEEKEAPAPPPGPTELDLLEEIRDLLQKN